jgi:hypothetical protein
MRHLVVRIGCIIILVSRSPTHGSSCFSSSAMGAGGFDNIFATALNRIPTIRCLTRGQCFAQVACIPCVLVDSDWWRND